MQRTKRRPKGVLFDYGGTLVDEVAFDPRAGNAWLLSVASFRPATVTLDNVLARASQVTIGVADLRDVHHIEMRWTALSRLIHDSLGIRFETPMADLELGFWKASVQTEPTAGAGDMLFQLHRSNIRLGVVSNTGFGERVIRFELSKHGLESHLSEVVVSADYSVRKPNVLLFEAAAARLGLMATDIWFVGDRLDTDVAGAKAAGMTAVWFNPRKAADTLHSADLSIADWAELLREIQ